jgi:hypothetical protein
LRATILKTFCSAPQRPSPSPAPIPSHRSTLPVTRTIHPIPLFRVVCPATLPRSYRIVVARKKVPYTQCSMCCVGSPIDSFSLLFSLIPITAPSLPSCCYLQILAIRRQRKTIIQRMIEEQREYVGQLNSVVRVCWLVCTAHHATTALHVLLCSGGDRFNRHCIVTSRSPPRYRSRIWNQSSATYLRFSSCTTSCLESSIKSPHRIAASSSTYSLLVYGDRDLHDRAQRTHAKSHTLTDTLALCIARILLCLCRILSWCQCSQGIIAPSSQSFQNLCQSNSQRRVSRRWYCTTRPA